MLLGSRGILIDVYLSISSIYGGLKNCSSKNPFGPLSFWAVGLVQRVNNFSELMSARFRARGDFLWVASAGSWWKKLAGLRVELVPPCVDESRQSGFHSP